MAIKFHCKRCHQLLGIASRKAGSEIKCPKCGIAQVVPNEEAAAAALAMTRFAKTREVFDDAADLVVYDDEPAAIETPRPTPSSVTTPATPATAAASGPAEPLPSAPGQPVPQDMILFPRRTVYVHGALLAIVAAVFFGAGYLMGRGDANYQQQAEAEAAAKERILVEGHVVYDLGSGQLAGDEDAVIIALPTGKFPEKPISFRGIRSVDEPPGENHQSVRMIVALGGTYTRADVQGAFSMVVPDRGRYRLLIISAHAARPAGAEIDEFDLSEMQQYFDLPDHLVHRYQYRWTTEEINIGFNPIQVEFGRDRQE